MRIGKGSWSIRAVVVDRGKSQIRVGSEVSGWRGKRKYNKLLISLVVKRKRGSSHWGEKWSQGAVLLLPFLMREISA